MRRAARTDRNHVEMGRALRKIGVITFDTSGMGGGFPDWACLYRGVIFLVEVKDGSKPPSQRKLTPAQEKFHKLWASAPLFIVETVEQLIYYVTNLFKSQGK